MIEDSNYFLTSRILVCIPQDRHYKKLSFGTYHNGIPLKTAFYRYSISFFAIKEDSEWMFWFSLWRYDLCYVCCLVCFFVISIWRGSVLIHPVDVFVLSFIFAGVFCMRDFLCFFGKYDACLNSYSKYRTLTMISTGFFKICKEFFMFSKKQFLNQNYQF